MAKKKQFVTAAAAFAVAASAVAPAITADAASTTVQLSSDYVRGGDLDAALDKEYKGSEIYWYKSSVDMNKLGVFQTAKGFVKGQGIRVEKKLRVLNHAQDIQPEEIVLEEGVPASGLRIQPVLFADGVKYNKVVTYAGFSTEKAGEFEGTFTYSNKAFGVVTKTVKYKVVKSEVEISNVSSSVDQAAEVLSVTADVKNLKDGEKVELVVYPGKDMSATPIKADATVKDGKLTVSKKLPAGTHSFQLVSGEVKSSVENFTIEAPMVKDVKLNNAKELVITFNKEIKKDSVITSDALIAGIISLNSSDAAASSSKAYLSNDGKSLTLVATTTWNGSYAFEVAKDKVEAVVSGQKVEEYKAFVSAEDVVRPTFSGVTYEANGAAKFTFSEPLDETAATIASKLVVTGPTSVSITASDISVAADGKSFTVTLPAAMTKDVAYTFAFTGLKDFAGNLSMPNPVTATVVNSVRDTVKPTVTNVVALDAGKLQVTFSEKIRPNTAVVTVGAAASSTYTLDSTGTVATFSPVTNLTAGVQSVTISGALDLAGLELDSVTRVIQVVADNAAPVYVNHSVETVGSDRFLVVNYNEEITANAGVSVTGTYVDSNNITQSVTAITGADITTGSDKKSVRVKLPATAGAYTLSLPANLARDTSAQTNGSAARSVTFTLGAAVDSTKPVVSTFAQTGNKVTVTFDRVVTAATALNVANYSIDGISSPFESAIFKGDAQTVELTLKNDVITTDGVRNYTVSNVATSAGAVMAPKTGTYNFKENVRPTVLGAKVLSSTEIEVTLSEALDSTKVGTDFDVFQGASTTALTDSEAISGTNKVIITLADPLTTLNGLTLKAASSIDLTDVNGNQVNFVGPITVTN
ncbi:Ig-like domain-containing protein [Exiguobacterium sp. BG5(2022)]|uniref:Ig-like domain-containing protein n=1 Tax=Exiguobacterium sp. BG5(2022) TaxID=2962595 RepID=UPI002880E5FA|nr:Ig-like domain-containing protein [Exiguobacterium sp. BG5(2022)]MDT0192385.1 hypothetical protein [Exiguobacterium sp. BG5(2022)]